MKSISLTTKFTKFFLIVGFMTIGVFSYAQKIAIIDIANVLENMDDYQKAQKTLDDTAESWKSEVDKNFDEIKGLYNKYQAEQVLMTEDAKKSMEKEIIQKEEQAREKQRQFFGPNGALFQKRQELVQPIQEKVYTAIERYATERGYDIILDKNSSTGILFANAKFDKTADIKKKLKIQ